MTGWIPLAERKPPKFAKYIVCARSADPEKPLIQMAWYHPEPDEWTLIAPIWAKNITHWMPVPAPPEG